VDRSGRIAFQVAAEGRVSLTLPLDANAGKASGAIIRRSFEAALDSGGRNSLDDAGRLLVYPKRSSGEGEIWVKDLTTGQERHLVTASSSPLNPVISHDGTKVAYTVFNRETAEGYVVSTTGGTARKVCDGCNLHGWFADDRRILFLNTTPGIVPGRARVLDVIDGKTLDLLVDATAGIGRVDVSPNGRWISFSGSRQVWIAPLRPGDPPQRSEWVSVHMIADDSAERACGWSPDGRLLYLLLERDGFRDLYAQRVDPLLGRPTGEPFIVQHLHDPPRSWGSTPYGTAIVSDAFVFNQMESTGTIWLLDTPSTGADASSREQ
jgi:Tol biopolymer transport system component